MSHRQKENIKNQEILLDIENEVATITLNRPQHGNSLTISMVTEFLEAFNKVTSDPSVRIIVVTGTGKYFCTGLDLKGHNVNIEEGIRFFQTVKECPKPVIAKINGPAFGGGVGFMFTMDIRIALSNAYFSFKEVKRGLVPAIISQYIIPEVGIFKTKQFMLTGEIISTDQALSSNFLTCTAKNLKELDNKVNKYINELLSSAPGAMSTIKKLVKVVNSNNDENIKINYIKQVFSDMMNSEEVAFGLNALRKKEQPNWSKFLSKL
ncbi:2501_t:CDS:1 [Diversispora eburnea]|uniref:2501_t:CDS:1 n=1 Tax=Diversispora eburnea TaxID=1213867 RepID=A0A9N8WQ83_9GLOM|nr:2501_t:CDS:1 [Diversispora eburnea]